MQQNNLTKQNNRSFTLIELLVVLALVAILSVVVILTLNPAELIKQARDSNRLSDLSTINTALNLFSADVTSGFMGTSTNVYVSIPSTLSDCSNLGLPALPSGYFYSCVTSANLRNTNGTGWIPVNFQRISSNSPISQLPVDPINTTSTRLYYTYVSGGSWELNASIEASKNKLGGSSDLVSKDGGSATSLYEIGNNLNLNPVETGDTSLVGYWNFEEGSGASTPDRSGRGNNGTWNGNGAHYVQGKVGTYAGQLNGVDDFSQIGGPLTSTSSLNITGPLTLSLWYYGVGGCGGTNGLGEIGAAAAGFQGYALYGCDSFTGIFGNGVTWLTTTAYTITPNIWSMISLSYDGVYGHIYVNGSEYGTAVAVNRIESLNNLNFRLGAHHTDGTGYIKGRVDDIRAYNRALSAAEISAIYNATK